MRSVRPSRICLERATSEYIPGAQENLALNLEISDLIKGKQVGCRDAMRSIRRRLLHRNPNVQLLAIKVCEVRLISAGRLLHQELRTPVFGRDGVERIC